MARREGLVDNGEEAVQDGCDVAAAVGNLQGGGEDGVRQSAEGHSRAAQVAVGLRLDGDT